MVTVSIRMCNPQGYAVFHAQVVPEVSGTFRTMGLSSRQSLEAHLRQDKLEIIENEGILHEVKISPAAYRRSIHAVAPDRSRYAL